MSFSPSPSCLAGSRSVQEQRDRWERKRTCTARELVKTEQHYCEQLELVITYFVEILKAKGTLRQDIRESIFSSIKSIHSVNQTLLVQVEQGNFGRAFEEFCPHLHHYTTYVDNIQNASKVLGLQMKKNKAFRRFKKLQESRREFRNCKLEDLLPLPIQRIQQYKHFLRDLTENTSPDNPEFQQLSTERRLEEDESMAKLNLCRKVSNLVTKDTTTLLYNPIGAVRAVSEVSQRIQDNARSHENHLQLRRVQKLLKGRKTKVLAPGRWYIREGWLRTVPPKGAETKPKMFFLCSDVLLQAKPCSSLNPTNGDKFTCQRAYPLKDCTVDKVFGHTKSQGGLLSLTFPKAKVLLMSTNQEDFNDWYRSLSSAVGQLRSRSTVVHQRDDLCRRALHSTTDSQQSTPATGAGAHVTPGRKRNMDQTPSSSRDAPAEPEDNSATKRMKLSTTPQESPPESEGSSCVIL